MWESRLSFFKMEKNLTLTPIRWIDLEFLRRVKNKTKVKAMYVIIERMIKVIRKHKMEEEI